MYAKIILLCILCIILGICLKECPQSKDSAVTPTTVQKSKELSELSQNLVYKTNKKEDRPPPDTSFQETPDDLEAIPEPLFKEDKPGPPAL